MDGEKEEVVIEVAAPVEEVGEDVEVAEGTT